MDETKPSRRSFLAGAMSKLAGGWVLLTSGGVLFSQCVGAKYGGPPERPRPPDAPKPTAPAGDPAAPQLGGPGDEVEVTKYGGPALAPTPNDLPKKYGGPRDRDLDIADKYGGPTK